MDICLLINTCKSYKSCLTKLIPKITHSKFPNENVLIVSAQENQPKQYYLDNIKIIDVKYTALHLTAMLYVCENIEKYENIKYFICLPDTIDFGKDFFDNILSFYNTHLSQTDNIRSVPFINPKIRPTMDMGILHKKHLLNMLPYLKELKTMNLNMNNLLRIKNQLILDENKILGFSPQHPNSNNNTMKKLEPEQMIIINNNRNEVIEKEHNSINKVHLKLLDLYKFQRNYGKGALVMSLKANIPKPVLNKNVNNPVLKSMSMVNKKPVVVKNMFNLYKI